MQRSERVPQLWWTPFKIWLLWLLGNVRGWCHGCFEQNSYSRKLFCFSIFPVPCGSRRKLGCTMTWMGKLIFMELFCPLPMSPFEDWDGLSLAPWDSKPCSTSWYLFEMFVKLLSNKGTLCPQTNKWWCLNDDTWRYCEKQTHWASGSISSHSTH